MRGPLAAARRGIRQEPALLRPRARPERRDAGQKIIRHNPIILAEVNRDDGPVQLVPCKPVYEGVVKASVRVQHKNAAFRFSPSDNGLPDERLEKFGFPGTGAARAV